MLNTDDYTYLLPPERIAVYPLESRDQSKLLFYDRGNITHAKFHSLSNYLPPETFLFFNDTKVIPARMHFMKDTGADIEIFLLNPINPSPLLVQAMQAEHHCTWKCTIGNLKRWKEGTALQKLVSGVNVEALLIDRNEGHVEFRWDSSSSFAEIISNAGETPLPPYLHRKSEAGDRERYQTIYSHYEGAVAAPTAGLHFTKDVFESLKAKDIHTDFLTLHVSAGTFQPIKVKNADEHVMHQEQIVVNRRNVENLLNNDFIVPVGTTSMRTIETLYWYGVKLLNNADSVFTITRDDQRKGSLPSKKESLSAVLKYMDTHQLQEITGETSIYITPGYRFQICKGLITNFHQPGSTLILLVAAFVGDDWKKIYESALENSYRFLSYGDSSLLIPN